MTVWGNHYVVINAIRRNKNGCFESCCPSNVVVLERKSHIAFHWSSWAKDIVEQGYSIVTITPGMQADFEALQSLVSDISFVARKTFSFIERTDGFHPVGYSHSKQVENYDLVESFNYWHKNKDDHSQFDFSRSEFYLRVANYESQVNSLGQKILDEIIRHFGGGREIDIRNDSYLQFNRYPFELCKTDDHYLQHKHEDGHLLTSIKPNAPGLVVYDGDNEVLVNLEPNQAVIISGSLLTQLTDGAIQPIYHAVMSFTLPVPRCSIIYNMNTLQSETKSLVSGRALRIGEIANEKHMQFGQHSLI